ncbi:MAG: MCP four helix bundle domain-containing protein [Bacteroidetes bacterium]|nr:MCP four helix bundle domain-containing protein [Bacteroidota bacterium]
MKWAYSIKNKLVASGALLSLCLLVLFSNYIDRDHTQNVKNSISTLYEDRLIAESYILKMTSSVYQIKEALNADMNDASKDNTINNLLLNIKELSNAYQKTKFTDVEKKKADELLITLLEFESGNLNNTQIKLKSANEALVILNELSAIQLDESKQIMAYAETLYLSGKTSSQFVFAIIIIILLVLQALVFTSKTLIPNNKTKSPNLN